MLSISIVPRGGRSRRAALVSAGVVAGVLATVASAGPGAAIGPADWPAYLRNPEHSSATFTETSITTGNAASLHQAWSFTPAAPSLTSQPKNNLEASPTVVDNSIYIGAGTGVMYALRLTDGHVLWRRLLDYSVTSATDPFCKGKGVESTATVAPDPVSGKLTVYVAGARYLYALDAATGAQRWRSLVGPASSASNTAYYNWSSPTVADGRIFMGISSLCDAPLIRGGVQSFDQATGASQHIYYTTAAGTVGVSVFSSTTTIGGASWVTTGNPGSSGTFDGYSILRLDNASLTRQDKWTVPLSDQSPDGDFGSTPVLFRTTTGIPAVGACNKNGFFYAWNRQHLAAGPIWRLRVGSKGLAFSCLASAVVNYQTHRLYIAANSTTSSSATNGVVREVDSTTGAVLWTARLPCSVLGTPSLDAVTDVLAVSEYGQYGPCDAGASPATVLLNAQTGAILATLNAGRPAFSQPVFAGSALLLGSGASPSKYAGLLVSYLP